MATTTIPLETETRDRLRLLGKKGETYDQILNRLMSAAESLTEVTEAAYRGCEGRKSQARRQRI